MLLVADAGVLMAARVSSTSSSSSEEDDKALGDTGLRLAGPSFDVTGVVERALLGGAVDATFVLAC